MSQMSFEFVVEGILLFIVAAIGIMANTIAIIMFIRKKKHTFFR